ncbi:hypothetical protein GCM10010327_60470 [Streptomyces nitrosporeus]|nr:hypothetical protein GCM10010327_60470 [Streptomyces nitrosporeus]
MPWQLTQGRIPARNGSPKEGKGLPRGLLPGQTQHAADHTRPKSMWSRETKRSWAAMPFIQPCGRPGVKHGPRAVPHPETV